MKWKKLGKIFDPTEHKLTNNCIEFAQSPQALVFDDFVRIYFSTREKDKSGKYLSHISFIEMDKQFKSIKRVAANSVIELGASGCFDEHGIFPLNVLRDGHNILGYIGGWSRRVSVSVETSIGLAISDDNGLTFKRIGAGPILSSAYNEPFLVGDPFVCIYDSLYHMYYIFGINWIKDPEEAVPDRVYKIGHAISDDGISWRRDGKQIIPDKLNSNECQALPTVVKFNNKYHMVFCYRQSTKFRKDRERGYRLGYALSDDLKTWIREDENVGITVSEVGWDSDMMCYPNIFNCEGKIYLLYNGNEFGRFGFGLAVLEDMQS
jgi:hypothetical protein